MAYYSNTIHIHCDDLGRSVTWMFCYETPARGIYEDYLPIAWNVSHFPAKGKKILELTYTAELVFTKATTSSGDYVGVDAYQPINAGEETRLVEEPSEAYYFTTPQEIPGVSDPKVAKAFNQTAARQPIGVGTSFHPPDSLIRSVNLLVGFMNGGEPNTVLYFTGVGVGRSIDTSFGPKLLGFITTDFKQFQHLNITMKDVKPDWIIDMTDPTLPDEWNLTFNRRNGAFKIAPRWAQDDS